jgi:hypothetical protein
MSGKRPLALLAGLLLVVVALAPAAVHGQSATTGLISGVVSDPSGAIVTGAAVTLVQHGTNAEQTTATDSVGRYVFPAVTPDDYTLKFSANGFAGALINDVHVEVLKAYNINMALKVGASTETVTVTEAPTAELQTTDATVGAVLGGEALDALPVFTRSASALMFYQPAVAPSGQIAGARDEQITFSFDGGDVTSDLEGNNTYAAPPGEPSPSPVIPIPIESTQEFQVSTTNPNSTFARSSGGQVALLTKAGSNNWHGSVYEYHNDDALNANGWTNDRLGINKPHSADNRFGGTTGGPIWKNKLFFFANYEGRRLHDDTIFNTVVPTSTLQSGIIEFRDAAGNLDQYSFQPGNITTACGGVSCDPRNIGLSPVIKSQLALYPTGNNPSLGDGLNTTGYTFDAPVPIAQDLGVLRLDYKINAKWAAFVTYHYSNTSRVGTEQFSIVNTSAPGSVAQDPIKPQFYTFEVTGQLTPSLTSVSHGSFLRDWWGWDRQSPTPLESGTEQALEVAGEGSGTSNSTSKLIADPVTLATQSARARVFDGHKWYLAQDLSWVKGNHLFQFGGSGYISHDYFEKTDNFAGGLAAGPIDYIESTGNGSGEFVSVGPSEEPALCGGGVTTNCLTSGNVLRYNELYTTLLGLVDRSSQVLTRNGDFQPNPLGTPAFSQTLIPAANAYFQDVWHVKPSFTLTMGLDWQVQPDPHEASGKYDVLVYASTNTPVDYNGYFQQRAASLNSGVLPGQAYNPLFGVTPVNFLPAPFTGSLRVTDWHEFAPRISGAWQVPFQNKFFGNNKTVIRFGYAIVDERISDIDQVSLPLTTGGLLDVDACGGPVLTGGSVVCTNGPTTPANAFRIGVDGNSVPVPAPTAEPIPYVPSGTAAHPFGLQDQSGLDPYVHPGYDHSLDFTVQRELPGKMILEVGYIGRFSRDLFQQYSLNASDYLMKDKASGQTYAQAFDGVAQALRTGSTVPVEPFFENQIGSAVCTAKGFSSCSAMVASQDKTDLINGSLNDFSLDELNLVAPTPIDNIQSFQSYAISDGGFSNYNAGFASLNKSFTNGLQFQANWTWSHAIGNQGVDQQNGSTANSPYNLDLDKSSEPFDRRHVVNIWFYYELPYGKGMAHSLNGVADKALGGWYVSGIYTFGTGTPLHISADGDYGDYESNGTAAICTSPIHGLEGQNYNVAGSNGVATAGGSAPNMFANPAAVVGECSRPLLSVNNQIPFDELRLLPRWNLDFSLGKKMAITERVHLELSAEALDIFNVVNFAAPSLNLNSLSNFGVYTSQGNTPRRLLLGAKLVF